MVAEMQHPSAGIVKGIKSAMHLSQTPLDSYAAPPILGEHTREVLTGLLGYMASEVEKLARDGVIGRAAGAPKRRRVAAEKPAPSR
jgi:formyl-CoA transferase